MLDLHTHILPGMDDGAADVDESTALLRLLAQQGVTEAVLSPHFYSHRESLDDFLDRREAAIRLLLDTGVTVLSDNPDSCSSLLAPIQMPDGRETALKLFPAAEIYLSDTLLHNDSIDKLTIGRERYVLIEMPFRPLWTSDIMTWLRQVQNRFDVTPVIAHVERYPATKYGQDIKTLKKLTDMGCLLQLNVDSILTRRDRRTVLKLLKNDWIDVLGSDSHNMSSRPPGFTDFRLWAEKKLGVADLSRWQLSLT